MKAHSRSRRWRLKYLLLVLCLAGGCSVYMEATRPTPVDLAKFTPGESRASVIEEIGAPVTTTRDRDSNVCDLHLLYITGYGAPVKVPLAVLEGASDFFTVGLAEIVLSPTESITRNEKKPIWFCYKNDSLVRVTVASARSESAPASPTPIASRSATAASASPTPSASSTPAPSPTSIPVSSGSLPE